MIYEYECYKCHYRFEEDLSVDERHLPTFRLCPNCGKLSVDKVVSLSHFKIKGYSSKNGFSKNVGDIEKHLGREITNGDLDD